VPLLPLLLLLLFLLSPLFWFAEREGQRRRTVNSRRRRRRLASLNLALMLEMQRSAHAKRTQSLHITLPKARRAVRRIPQDATNSATHANETLTTIQKRARSTKKGTKEIVEGRSDQHGIFAG
jgi:hypothetical protein